MDREHLERLLREPDNLFGPPTGRGYDYLGAGLVVASLALAALSGWCLFTAWDRPDLPPALTAALLLAGAPFCLGGGLLWPLHLAAGWAGAAAVWYATLYAAAGLAGLRRCGRLALVCAASAAAAGWVGGACLAVSWWRGAG